MKVKAQELKIGTGGSYIVVVNQGDADLLDLHDSDRVRLKHKRRFLIARIDIATDDTVVRPGSIGLFRETFLALGARKNAIIDLSIETKPTSLKYIRKKLEGETLSRKEIDAIIEDIVDHKLDDIETTYFVAACTTRLMTDRETVDLTKAMIKYGDILKFTKSPVIDKHCVGGVAGNRTTPIIVPIVAAHGLLIPKTSSRSITSPAGTADTMEVLTDVSLSIEKIRKVVRKTDACLVWGGAINLAPADDQIIRVEHPLSIDSRSQLIASILAKKASVSATHVLVDIPAGRGSKIENIHKATSLKRQFESIGKKVGMKIVCLITDGTSPIGNGFGPILEAKDVLYVLLNDRRGPPDLKQKSVLMAGRILEMAGKAKVGKGYQLALATLESGEAWLKFKDIVVAQGRRCLNPEMLRPGHHRIIIRSDTAGLIHTIDNDHISKIARLAGAPKNQGAGILLSKHKNEKVKKGDVLFTIFSDSKQRLGFAKEFAKDHRAFLIR